VSFVHSKKLRLVVDGLPFSGYAHQVGMSCSKGLGEATVFTDEGNRFTSGLLNGTLSIGCRFDPTPHGSLGAALTADDPQIVTIAPAGFGTGGFAFMAHAFGQTYAVDASISDTVNSTFESQPDDGVDWGRSHHDLTVETVSGESAGADDGAATAGGIVAHLHVTAVAGTTSTLDVTVQESADGNTWADIGAFAQATAVGAQRVFVAGAVEQHIRITWELGGTGPSFTFTAAVARR